MLRRLMIFVVAVIVVHAAVYFTFFKRDAAARALKGYKRAETPQIAAEQFKKAIEARDFEYAADYCTAPYAEELKKGADAAAKLRKAMEEFSYQCNERKLLRDEILAVMWLLDPFPKDIVIQVGNASSDMAEATITFQLPKYEGGQPPPGKWEQVRSDFARALLPLVKYQGPLANILAVKMKKEKGEWKFDVPVDSGMPARIAVLNQKHMNFANAFDTIKSEVRNDDTTKENVTQRLKELLEQASRE